MRLKEMRFSLHKCAPIHATRIFRVTADEGHVPSNTMMIVEMTFQTFPLHGRGYALRQAGGALIPLTQWKGQIQSLVHDQDEGETRRDAAEHREKTSGQGGDGFRGCRSLQTVGQLSHHIEQNSGGLLNCSTHYKGELVPRASPTWGSAGKSKLPGAASHQPHRTHLENLFKVLVESLLTTLATSPRSSGEVCGIKRYTGFARDRANRATNARNGTRHGTAQHSSGVEVKSTTQREHQDDGRRSLAKC